jgi:CheY-like chemotaxis protein
VGHRVIEATGGADGLARFAENPVDLILTDLGMPEVNGWDVARAVKAASPHLPVVLLTGWGEHVAGDADSGNAVDRILGKPFRLEELLRAIGDLTAGR